MRNKKIKLSALLLCCLGLTGLKAQQTISGSGGTILGDGRSATYTLGQIFYVTLLGEFGSAAQGVQQPYEISIISGIEDDIGLNYSSSVYPNPTNDYLALDVEDFYMDDLTYRFYNFKGKLLESKKVLNGVSIINVDNLVPSTYFLKLMQGKKEIKTFKIIKN